MSNNENIKKSIFDSSIDYLLKLPSILVDRNKFLEDLFKDTYINEEEIMY